MLITRCPLVRWHIHIHLTNMMECVVIEGFILSIFPKWEIALCLDKQTLQWCTAPAPSWYDTPSWFQCILIQEPAKNVNKTRLMKSFIWHIIPKYNQRWMLQTASRDKVKNAWNSTTKPSYTEGKLYLLLTWLVTVGVFFYLFLCHGFISTMTTYVILQEKQLQLVQLLA